MIILGVILHVIEVAVEKIDNILKDSVIVPLALPSALSDPTVRVWLEFFNIIFPARRNHLTNGAKKYKVTRDRSRRRKNR